MRDTIGAPMDRHPLAVDPVPPAPPAPRPNSGRFRAFEWTPERVAAFDDGISRGGRDREIAKRIGCSAKIVYERRAALGLLKREATRARPWSEKDIADLRARYQFASDRDLAAYLNRSKSAIRDKRVELGLEKTERNPDEDDGIGVRPDPLALSRRELAAIAGMSQEAAMLHVMRQRGMA